MAESEERDGVPEALTSNRIWKALDSASVNPVARESVVAAYESVFTLNMATLAPGAYAEARGLQCSRCNVPDTNVKAVIDAGRCRDGI